MGWIQRKTRMVIVAIGCSLGLFGCVAMEGTTTVLEDGRVIERVQLSPKRSLWAVLALMADNFAIDLKSDALSRGEASDIVSELRRGMEDMCVMADFLFEQPYADLSIPVSTTRMPLEFEIAGAIANGCSVQIGPYDPRTLPAIATAMLGMRVELLPGAHDPYRLTYVIPRSTVDAGNAVDYGDVCTGDVEPARCRDDFEVLHAILDDWKELFKDEPRLMSRIEDKDLLLGIMEAIRMTFASIPVTSRLRHGVAVDWVSEPSRGQFTREGLDWLWRGSMMDAFAMEDFTITVHPTRAVDD